MKYKCLILDHDDTVADSTRSIHFPAFNQMLAQLRPDAQPFSLEQWFLMLSGPGLSEQLRTCYGFSDDELEQEFLLWNQYRQTCEADFFPGLIPILRRFQQEGGFLTVVTHNVAQQVHSDYMRLAPDLKLSCIIGYEGADVPNKPLPDPVYRIQKLTGSKLSEMLVVDDLSPGMNMARTAGVDFALAAWAHSIEKVFKPLEEYALCRLNHPSDLEQLLFS